MRRHESLGRLFLVFGCVVFGCGALGCASLAPEGQRERSVSESTFARVLPYLEDLAPGDSLRLFERARVVQVRRSRQGERPVVLIPAWIPSLSGGAGGGLSMLGQLIGRRGDALYGSHVFGFMSGDRIVPRFQVMTRATRVDAETFRDLSQKRVRDIGLLPRRSGVVYFRDLHVVATRALDFAVPADPELEAPADSKLEAPADSKLEAPPLPESAQAFYSEVSYREIAPALDALPEGTDLLSMLWILDAAFVSHDYGETHSLFAKGFLNYRAVRTVTVEAPSGLFKLRPFGFVDGDQEVVKRILIFENDRLQRVVRHDGRSDWRGYLVEAPDQAAGEVLD